MIDRSLFPDYAPDRTVKPKGAQRRACCGTLTPPPHVSARVWEFVHDMAHGRVPFTLASLAELAGVEMDEARRAALAAQRTKWLTRIEPNENFPRAMGPHFIGRLKRKARAT